MSSRAAATTIFRHVTRVYITGANDEPQLITIIINATLGSPAKMSSDMPENPEQAPPAASGDPEAQTTQNGPEPEQDPVAPGPERLPTRKDVSLRELLNKIDDYAPVVRSLSP